VSRLMNTSLASTSSFFWSSPWTFALPAMPSMPAKPACRKARGAEGRYEATSYRCTAWSLSLCAWSGACASI
jgi:hypothetical protein